MQPRNTRLTCATLGITLGIAFLAIPYEAFAAAVTDKPVGWASQDGGTTGGAGGTEVTVTTLSALNTELKKTGKLVIWVQGTITGRVDVPTNDKSILGRPGAKIVGGIDITGSTSQRLSNIVVRNLEIEGPGSNDVDGVDCIAVQYASKVWLDHLHIRDGQDGNLDMTNEADLITVSDVKFSYTKGGNHRFCMLIGSSDERTTDRGKLRITLLNNWFAEGVMERMPRVRFGQVHVVNNLFASSGNNHCVRGGIEADIRVEGNVFIGVKEPIDFFEDDFKAITATNNVFTNTTGNTSGRGTAFTPPYSITVAAPNTIEAKVKNAQTGAGPNLTWGAVVGLHMPKLRAQGASLRLIPDEATRWFSEPTRVMRVDGLGRQQASQRAPQQASLPINLR
jgi:pectate lyase